jgi:PrtD family type I secretion system ABC transporter
MLRQVRRALLVTFLFSGCINVLMLSTPLYTLQVFETVVPLGSIETLVILTAITAAAILALALIEMVRDLILLRAGLWLDHELGQHMLENGLKLGTPGAELNAHARALEQLKQFLTTGGITVLFDAPWVPLFLVALAVLNPLIGVVAAVAAAALIVAAILQSMLTGRLLAESARAHERSEQWWSAVTGNALMSGALGLSPGASRQWESYNRAHIASAYSLGKRTSFVKAIARSVRIGSQVALYAFGAWLVVKGEMTPGALVASAILLARALAPLEQLVVATRTARAAIEGYRRLRGLPADAVLPRVGSGEDAPAGRVTLNDVTFYHPTRRAPALRGVSLTLQPGECLGIVGPNGSGKSTLAAILAGAQLPATGSADLDGIPIAKWQRGGAAPPIGYLPDDPGLIEGSVHANIARFSDASLLSVARAGMRAGVHDTLAALASGYDTEVGPGGGALSLRERRAVAFARAVFGAPRVVVFDEPELGLDGGSLRALTNTLKTLKSEGISLVVATQDPRLLALTDRIVVLNAGAVEIQGTAQEVSRQINSPAPRTAAAAMH